MGARPSTPPTKPIERPGQQPAKARGARKLNRSEQQALRIRAAATAAASAAAADDVPAEGARPVRTGDAAYRSSKATRTRAVHYGVTLSREQEMAFIRSDLRRLLWISGALLIGMFVLLALLQL